MADGLYRKAPGGCDPPGLHASSGSGGQKIPLQAHLIDERPLIRQGALERRRRHDAAKVFCEFWILTGIDLETEILIDHEVRGNSDIGQRHGVADQVFSDDLLFEIAEDL